MYTIDDLDRVEELDDLPPHSPGAPMPLLLADDNHLLLSYEVGLDGQDIAMLEFVHHRAHYFGSPNDEALTGHPLATRGLQPYGIFEVRSSSWIRSLERMNRVHRLHDRQRFDRLRHFVFTFHDCTLECVAENAIVFDRRSNDGESSLARMAARLQGQP